MKTVRLPIYEDGTETNEVLEVSVELFRKLAATSIAFKGHVRVVPKETKDAFTGQKVAEVEIETIDRIIHGLSPEPKRIPRDLTVDEAHERGYFMEPSPGRPYYDWRKIPGFEGYTMNPRKIIICEATDKTVGQERGAQGAKVLLSDEDGVGRRYSVDYLFAQTFPELNK
jgi:hypothetical protein